MDAGSPDDDRGPDRDQVEDWRLLRFLDLGFELERAQELARDRAVDWHQVDELVRAGCTPETALRILL